MMTVEQMRESFNKQLEAWHAAVQAFEVQAQLGKQEALDRLESQKAHLAEALERMKAESQRSLALAERQRQALVGAFDHLRLQLALGRAESRELLEQQERAVREAVAWLDGELNRSLASVSEATLEQYVRWSNLVKAEFEAASAQFSQVRDRQQALWQAGLKAFEVNLETFRNQLADAQRQANLQAHQAQQGLAAGMEQLRQAFHDLFNPGQKP